MIRDPPLYRAQVGRPFSGGGALRPWYKIVDWCEVDDLIAVVSGCGAAVVFHADSPGEVVTLTAERKAPAKHVRWRPAVVSEDGKPSLPVLLVVDAAGRVTLWVSQHRRINVWEPAATAEVKSAVMAIGWIRNGTAIAAVLADGNLIVWNVHPVGGKFYLIPCSTAARNHGYLGENVRLASIAPGGVDVSSVAVLCTMASAPTQVHVWHISVGKLPVVSQVGKQDAPAQRPYELKDLGSAKLDDLDGNVSACLAAPRAGSLYIWGDKGRMGRWVFAKNTDWKRVDTVTYPGLSIAESSGDEKALAALKRVTAASVSEDGELVVFADGNRTVRVYAGKGNELPQIAEYDSAERDAMVLGICISPSAYCMMALQGSGVLYTYSNDYIRPAEGRSPAEEHASRLILATSPNGRRGGWDIRALLARRGRESSAAVAKAIQQMGENLRGAPLDPEKVETLRLAILASPDEDTGSVAAARRLLEIAMDAIRTTAPSQVLENFFVEPVQHDKAHSLCSHVEVIRRMQKPVASGVPRPTLYQVTAAHLADWILVLGIVWLRRVACFVARSGGSNSISPIWREVVAKDAAEAAVDRVSIIKDQTLTRILKNSVLAAASLLVAEAAARPHGEPSEHRYVRLSKDDTADVVAAIWDASRAADSGGPAAIAAALGRHQRAGQALLANGKLQIRFAERALGLRGACHGAGFILASLRAGRQNQDPNIIEPEIDDEWCPYDIITGRILPAWAPLRRCVSSGLLATEITNPPEGIPHGTNGIAPWALRWATESPFGGLWARVPSLDLDRYELLNSSELPEELRRDPRQGVVQRREDANEHEPDRQSAMLHAGPGPGTQVPTQDQPHAISGHAQLQMAGRGQIPVNMRGAPGGPRRPGPALQGAASSPAVSAAISSATATAIPRGPALGQPARFPLEGMSSPTLIVPGQSQNLEQLGSPSSNMLTSGPSLGAVSSSSDLNSNKRGGGRGHKAGRGGAAVRGQHRKRKGDGTGTPTMNPKSGASSLDFAVPLNPSISHLQEDAPEEPSYSTNLTGGGGTGVGPSDNQSQVSTDTGLGGKKKPRAKKSKPQGPTPGPNPPTMVGASVIPSSTPAGAVVLGASEHYQPSPNLTAQQRMTGVGSGQSIGARMGRGVPVANRPGNVEASPSGMMQPSLVPQASNPAGRPHTSAPAAPQVARSGAAQHAALPRGPQISPGSGPVPARPSNRIWEGSIRVHSPKQDLIVPCVAITHSARDRANLRSAVGWPAELQCTRSRLKSSTEVWPFLNDPNAQWYVRFSPVDPQTGTETVSQRLMDLVRGMVERKLAFELDCVEDRDNPGKLYLWGFNVQGMGYSLLGVYRPMTAEVATGDDAATLLDDLLGGM